MAGGVAAGYSTKVGLMAPHHYAGVKDPEVARRLLTAMHPSLYPAPRVLLSAAMREKRFPSGRLESNPSRRIV